MTVTGLAHGGDGVGRLPDGRACFVPFALPGERVRVRVVEQRKRYARARLEEVLEPSVDRVAPPCPYFGPGRCGGCQLQHAAPQAQARLKAEIVRDLLMRIGGIDDPPVQPVVSVPPLGYRSTARFAVDAAGRLGFRRAGSHEVQPVDRCLLLDPATQRLRERAADGWGGAAEVTVRTGGGADALLVKPAGPGPEHQQLTSHPLPPTLPVVWLDGAPPLDGHGAVTMAVAGFDLRVSPGSFFQPGPQGAALLLAQVRRAAAVRPGDVVLELFAGVGLFTLGLAQDGGAVTAVEASPAAVADLRSNVAGTGTRVVAGDATEAVAAVHATAQVVDVVVLDPPRRGAGRQLSESVAGLGARTVVYVACDPAALARDAATLLGCGYDLTRVVPVDQFPQTATIEAVATFSRTAGEPGA